MAGHAQAFNLDGRRLGPEAHALRRTGQDRSNGFLLQLPRPVTAPADQKLRPVHSAFVMVVAAMRTLHGMRTAHEGAQPLQTVDQAVFQQEIQRPVHGGRGGFRVGWAQSGQKIISPGRLLAGQDQPQHLTTRLGQALPVALAPLGREVEALCDLGRKDERISSGRRIRHKRQYGIPAPLCRETHAQTVSGCELPHQILDHRRIAFQHDLAAKLVAAFERQGPDQALHTRQGG